VVVDVADYASVLADLDAHDGAVAFATVERGLHVRVLAVAQALGQRAAERPEGLGLGRGLDHDTDAAYEAVSEFDPARTAAVVIVKHANPCGVAEGDRGRLLGGVGRDDHFREDLDDLLRGFRVQRAVERPTRR
jgi:phosphoribosylaminoimidazolecarboxamide formyltransferase/IMP cyclohydrolase